MILRLPSSETTARCRESGEKAKALILELDTFQHATGLVFWLFDWTDFLICRATLRSLSLDAFSDDAACSSATNDASSFSLS